MSFQAFHREHIIAVLDAAIRAVDPRAAVRAHVARSGDVLRIGDRSYRLSELDRIIVVGGGKAGAPMAAAIHEILPERITAGAVNVKYGHAAGAGGWQVRFEHRPLTALRSRDPMRRPRRRGPIPAPSSSSKPATRCPMPRAWPAHERIAALLQGLTERDLVIVLISGGGSALLPLPADAITLADYQALTSLLLRCGADITEVNTVRKHCSRLQGGQLARLAAPAQVATLILSDVVGTPLDAIASGPTVPDRSSFADAWRILERYGIAEQAPAAVCAHLRRGVAGSIPDTPKPGDPLFERVNNVVIGDNASAGRAAVAEAKRLGFTAALLTTFLQGEAREVGRVAAGLAQGIASGQSDFCAAGLPGARRRDDGDDQGAGDRGQESGAGPGCRDRAGGLCAAARRRGRGGQPGHGWHRRPDGRGRRHRHSGQHRPSQSPGAGCPRRVGRQRQLPSSGCVGRSDRYRADADERE